MPTDGSSDGARSIWKDEHSITCTAGARRLERQDRGADIAAELHVVARARREMRDQRGRGRLAVGAGDRDERRVGRVQPPLAAEQLDVADDLDGRAAREPTVQCGAGWVSGTPGASTSAAIFDQSIAAQIRGRNAGRLRAFAIALGAVVPRRPRRRRPPAARWRSRAPSRRGRTARPSCRRSVVTGIIDPHRSFSVDEPGQRQHDRDDPEADHDLRLGPALLLEMVVERRHPEHALAGQLERDDLHDHRHRLEHEQAADDRQHDFVLGRDRDGAEQRRRARASRCRP